jgi:hypothetical protein
MIEKKKLIKNLIKLKGTYKKCSDNPDIDEFYKGAVDALNIVIEYLEGLKD